jgi:hypothetical protein
MEKSFAGLRSEVKVKLVNTLEDWNVATDEEIRTILERISLSDFEKKQLKHIISRVKAFKASKPTAEAVDDDLPF